ncbi:MAG: hypothetical protein HY315_03115 [Acidobacteria bacterium]|nr:hypothetical protein [Acidobacteriota bacterium]
MNRWTFHDGLKMWPGGGRQKAAVTHSVLRFFQEETGGYEVVISQQVATGVS